MHSKYVPGACWTLNITPDYSAILEHNFRPKSHRNRFTKVPYSAAFTIHTLTNHFGFKHGSLIHMFDSCSSKCAQTNEKCSRNISSEYLTKILEKFDTFAKSFGQCNIKTWFVKKLKTAYLRVIFYSVVNLTCKESKGNILIKQAALVLIVGPALFCNRNLRRDRSLINTCTARCCPYLDFLFFMSGF